MLNKCFTLRVIAVIIFNVQAVYTLGTCKVVYKSKPQCIAGGSSFTVFYLPSPVLKA